MSRLVRWLDRVLYPNFSDRWDDVLFRRVLLEHVTAESACLDYGAGRGRLEQMAFRNIARFVAGVDPDEAVLNNPYLHEAKVLDLRTNRIPYPDATFDVVYASNVLEHVQDPQVVFNEIARVLQPGGVFLAKTPNKWHYVPCMARATPTWFHAFYNRLRGRESADTFPTVYRCNTRRAIARCAPAAGLTVREIRFVEGRPEYLRLTFPTYLLGALYERAVNAFDWLQPFRCVLICRLQKPAEQSAATRKRSAA